MLQLILVGVGGFVGVCLRYGLGKIMMGEGALPLATLIANVCAGFLIGVVIGTERQFGILAPKLKSFLTTGFLGGLSTFSAFSLETVTMLEQGKYGQASLNTTLNVGLSFAAVVAGLYTIKAIGCIAKG